MNKPETTRIFVRATARTRALMIIEAGRRVLEGLTEEMPSLNSLGIEIFMRQLGLDYVSEPSPSRDGHVFMGYLPTRLHVELKRRAELGGMSGRQLLEDLIEDVYFLKVKPARDPEITDKENMTTVSYKFTSRTWNKLSYELARRAVARRGRFPGGRDTLPGYADLIAEILASAFDMPLPAESRQIPKKNEIMGLTFVIPRPLQVSLSAKLKVDGVSLASVFEEWVSQAFPDAATYRWHFNQARHPAIWLRQRKYR